MTGPGQVGIRGWIVLALVVTASAVAGWTAGGQHGKRQAAFEWTAANVASDTRSSVEIRRDMDKAVRR